jgi:hypothetical protein
MKKIFFCLVLINLIFSIGGCRNSKSTDVSKEIQFFNENSNFDYNLGESYTGLIEGFTKIEGFGSFGLKSEDGLTEYLFSGYPDVLDAYVLTSIKTKSPKYNLCGYYIGQNIKNIKGDASSLDTIFRINRNYKVAMYDARNEDRGCFYINQERYQWCCYDFDLIQLDYSYNCYDFAILYSIEIKLNATNNKNVDF